MYAARPPAIKCGTIKIRMFFLKIRINRHDLRVRSLRYASNQLEFRSRKEIHALVQDDVLNALKQCYDPEIPVRHRRI